MATTSKRQPAREGTPKQAPTLKARHPQASADPQGQATQVVLLSIKVNKARVEVIDSSTWKESADCLQFRRVHAAAKVTRDSALAVVIAGAGH